MTSAGIVDDAVEAAVTGGGLGDDGVNLLALRDIGGKIDGLAALRRDHIDGRRAALGAPSRLICHHHARGFGREYPGPASRDGGGAAGDDPCLIRESEL